MAYYDHVAAERFTKEKEAYEHLKELLRRRGNKNWDKYEGGGNGVEAVLFDVDDNVAAMAFKHMSSIENDLKESKEALAKYGQFFLLMKQLMPKTRVEIG